MNNLSQPALCVAAMLLAIGGVGLLVRRNILFVLLAIEIMLNAAGLAFVAAGADRAAADGQVMFLLVLAFAAAEVSIGLALVLRFHHLNRTLDVDKASTMQG